jgi:peptide chain release factor 1
MEQEISPEEKYEKIIEQLSNPELVSNRKRLGELSKEKKQLEEIIETKKELEKIEKQIKENNEMINSGQDSELSLLAEAEIRNLNKRKENLEKITKGTNQENSEDSINSVIIEIRAGTGGKEAALFAGDLFKMYSKYALLKNWEQKTLNSHQDELGGFKEIIFQLKGKDIWSKMKYEGGVHRVQRIPETEKSGRIHTSTATVAILPKANKTELNIKPDDLRIDLFRSSGPGGQNVNKRETAVRITHIPSGIAVSSQTERNQLQNKESAMSILEAKLLEKKKEAEIEKTGSKRKNQIGQAKRAEKIRTYNFPQDRVTEHRIKKNWHNIEGIMEGDMEQIVKSLQKDLEE